MFRKKTLLALIIATVILITVLFGCTAEERYTVSFESNGGSYERPIRVYADTEEMVLPTPTKTGYNFDGWFYDEALSASVDLKKIPTENVTFYARWSLKRVSVTFFTDGFSQAVFVNYGSSVPVDQMPEVPVKEGFTGAWDTSVLSPDGQKENVRVPAIYTPVAFTVKYMVDGEVYFERTDVADAAIDVPADPQLENSVFLGWYADESFATAAAPPKAIASHDVTLYARFKSAEGMVDYLNFTVDGEEITVTGLKNTALNQTVILIPSEIDGKAVTAVGSDSGTDTFLSEKLELLYIPSSVKRINPRAFANCSFKTVKLNEGLETIESEAFADCLNLTVITIPSTVVSIGDYVFKTAPSSAEEGAESSETVISKEIAFSPSSMLRNLGIGVFDGLTLESFTLPDSADYVFDAASFKGCKINNIGSDSNNYAVYKNAVYNATFTELMYLPTTTEGEVTLHEFTEKIGANALENCDKITKILMLSGVKSIGDYAFRGCKALANVEFEENSLLESVGKYAFADSGITSLSLSSALKTMGDHAFYNAADLKLLELSECLLTEIPLSALENCASLLYFGIPTVDGSEKTYLLPETVEIIRERAFFGCAKLSAFGFTRESVLSDIESYAFADCFSLGTVNLQSTVDNIGDYAFSVSDPTRITSAAPNIPDAIKSIGYRAFANSSVTRFNPAAYLTYLGEEAFMGCVYLQSLNLSNIRLTELPTSCFSGCTKITDISLSATINALGDFAFYNCTNLRTVKFGISASGGVKNIGESAFENCKKLNSTTSTAIPDGLTTIGKRAYFGCSSLNSFIVPSELKIISEEAFASCTALETVTFTSDSVTTTLSDRCFADCTALRSVSLPSSLGTHDDDGVIKNPFIGCNNLTSFTISNHPTLTSEGGVLYRREGAENAVYLYPNGGVINEKGEKETAFTVGSTVTKIDDYAFYGSAIASLSFDDSRSAEGTETVTLVEIGKYAFAYSSITNADIGRRVYKIDDYAFYGSKLEALNIDAETIAVGENTTVTNLGLASNDLTINAHAFGNTKINTLSLPSRTKSIGEGAFSDCFVLNTLSFSDDGALTIGKRAFENDTRLASVVLTKSVTEIGDYAFLNCHNIESLTFNHGDSPVSVGAYAFKGNHYLKSVSLPGGVNKLGEGVFSDCTELTSVTLPTESAFNLELPDYAFYGSKHLLDISIPTTVTRIGAHAFENGNLRRISFAYGGSERLYIGEYAFRNVKDLKSVALPDRLASIGKHAFEGSGLEEFSYSSASDGETQRFSIGEHAFSESGLKSVALDSARVSHIGEYAFANTVYLNNAVLCGSPFDVPDGAFEGSSVADVTVEGRLGRIGEYAFANTPNLNLNAEFDTEVEFADYAFFNSNIDSVTLSGEKTVTVGIRAFANAAVLTSFVAPDATISIGDFAFENSGISVLILNGEKITSMGVGVAAAASKLAEITITGDLGSYYSENGILYYTENDNISLIQYPAAKEGAVLDLNTDVNFIADYAFFGNKNLTTLVIRGEKEISCEENSFGQTNSALTLYTAEARIDDFADWALPVSVLKEELNELVVKLKIGNTYSVIGYTGTQNSLTINGLINGYRIDSIDKNAFANNARLKSIKIGSGITEIGEYAFYNCVALQSFTFGENVNVVKAHAFENCRNLTTFKFGRNDEGGLKSTLTFIADYAFARTGLKKASLPATVNAIGSYAFAYNTDLAEVTFAENSDLCEIANDAFSYDSALTALTLPESLKKLDNFVFRGCESLTYLYFNSPTAPSLKSVNSLSGTPDGLKIFVDAALLQGYRADPHWRAYAVQMLAKDDICTIEGFEDYVLSSLGNGNYRLICHMGIDSDITIETNVTGLGKITEIGEQAFNQFAETITLGEGVTHIDDNAFITATSLKVLNLPIGLQEIGAHAFEGLVNLTNVNIHPYSELNTIGEYAFFNCVNLEEFTFPRKLKYIGSYAFGGDTEMNLIDIDSQIGADISLYIGEYAFENNVKLRSLKFDCAVESLLNGAFKGCTELGALYLNATGDIVPSIDGSVTEVFSGCDRLSVFVPNSTGDAILARYRERWKNSFDRALLCTQTKIAKDYTDEDGNLISQDGFVVSPIDDSLSVAAIINYIGNDTVVKFPSKVSLNGASYKITAIGRDSNQSESRTNGRVIGNTVTQIIIPDTVTEIYGDAFRGAAKLNKVVFEENSSLKSIGNYAFADCALLQETNIPKTLANLNAYAFYNCANLQTVNFEAPDDSLNATSLIIGEHAFENCLRLNSLRLPTYLSRIEQYAFYGAASLEKAEISADGRLTEIARYAFGETALKGISLPAAVASVGSSAFYNCNELKYVRLRRVTGSGYTSLTNADSNVFNGVADPFVKVYVPDIAYASYNGATGWSAKTIVPDLSFTTDMGAFTYRLNSSGGTTVTLTGYTGDATELTMPSTFSLDDRTYYVTTVAPYFGNAKLKSVVFESTYITTLDSYAFADCTALEKIVVADSVEFIERYAFNNCTALRDVTLPSSLRQVSPFTFAGCSSLIQIRIPAGVSKIDDSAFINCVNLSRVEIAFEEAASSGRNVFANTGVNLVIVVPDGRKSAFQNEWRDYSSNIYDRSERYGDFLLTENETGYTLIQYIGHSDILNLNEMTFNGKRITEIRENAVIDKNTQIIFGEENTED